MDTLETRQRTPLLQCSNLGLFAITTLLFLFCSLVKAESQLQLNYFGKKDGLISPMTYQTIEDEYGFLWIATTTGLQRYDGNTFKTFKHEPNNKNSLSENYVRCLLLDDNGNIWVGTESGLNIYLQDEEKFILFDFELDAKKTADAHKIRALYKSSDGTIWIGSYAGLTKYNPKTNKKITYDFSIVRTITEKDSNSLLIGTLGQGLYIFSEGNFQEINHFSLTDQDKLKTAKILDIIKDNDGDFLIATWGLGIYKIPRNSKKLVKPEFNLPSPFISNIKQEENGTYWFGTLNGLILFNKENEYFRYVEYSDKYGSNTGLNIKNIFISKNLIWLSSLGQGLYLFNTNSRLFENYTTHKISKEGLLNKEVISLVEMNDKEILVGGEYGHIAKFHPKNETFTHYDIFENNQKLKQSIYHIKKISDDKAVVSLIDKSFILNTQKTKQEISKTQQYDFIKNFILLENLAASKEQFLAINKEKKLVLIGINSDLQLYIKQTYPFYLKSEWAGYFITKEQKVYLVYPDGNIDIFNNLKLNQETKLTIKANKLSQLSAIHIDEKGNILQGVFNTKLKYLRHINDNIYSKEVKTVNIDDASSILYNNLSNQYWLSSESNLFQLDRTTYQLAKYGVEDGILSDGFGSSAIKASDGSFYFSGVSGFTRFFPDKIKPNLKRYPVKLTDFLLAGKYQKPSKNKQSVLKKSIINTKAIQLNYKQNAFGFQFAALAYLAPHRIKYAYKLDGYDNEWYHVDSKQRYANYTNIPPGEYTFRVKAQNKNQLWSEQDTTVKITITPPWWLTPYAYVAYIILTILSIYILVAYRTNTLEKRSQMLEESINQRTQELAKEKHKVEQLLSRKNEEFANVSHEFRTPLTLILGPVTQLINKYKDTQDNERLNVIQRNGYRLLRMVDQLLNMETFKVQSITQKSPQAFAETIQLITQAFEDIAREKNITLEIKQLESIYFEFTVDALDKIILNLLSNAIKYTPSGGHISIATYRKNNELVITVTDTGIGIAEEKQAHIFDRFHRVLDENSEKITGAGIGLALVKDLVEAHQGKINVTSQIDNGTEFSIYLPIINEVDASQVNQHSSSEIVAMELMSLTRSSNKQSQADFSTQTTHQQITVLVIEDNQDMRDYITHNIQSNYHVLTANNGEAGVKLAETEIPDIIISDIMMPKMDGYQVTQALRQNPITDHIPIILLTARSDLDSRLKGWQEKADEYLTKPFDIDELKLRLENLLSIRDILKKRFAENIFKPSKHLKKTNYSEKSHSESLEQEASFEPKQEVFLQKLNQVLSQLYQQSDTKVSHIAELMASSERQLSRKLKSILDLTPSEYLRRFRLEKAKQLLEQGKSANYVTFEVGFSSQSYFSKCFKAQFDCLPSEFLNQ